MFKVLYLFTLLHLFELLHLFKLMVCSGCSSGQADLSIQAVPFGQAVQSAK
jgi:hypothetical protein